MYDLPPNFKSNVDEIVKSSKLEKENAKFYIRFEGHNYDITESYYWIYNFAYYVGKGYVTIKLEDHHYFSENSQYGSQLRQVKGGSIRAFQENFQQLITLVRSHLLPLLKEVKQADFYHRWIQKIVENDEIVQNELKKGGNLKENKKYNDAKNERDEAINHLKDKWVNEVEGGRIWQMSRSSTEQGLDFSLLPQLFFGTNLQNPLYELHKDGPGIKEQLDSDIYSIDISEGAKEQVARQMYKFYYWLPSAIRDTQVTFKLKLSALKNIYSQVQMYIEWMKPLLIEIHKKSEAFDKNSFYRGFGEENHEIANLFDSSYMFIRNLGIRDFGLKERGQPWEIKDLQISPYGLFIKKTKEKHAAIAFGKYKEESGYIIGEKDGDYEFIVTDITPENMDQNTYSGLLKNKVTVKKNHLKKFPIIETVFLQRRRYEVTQTPQGPQQVPYMKNEITFYAKTWNLFEIAIYRESIKEKNLELIETFVDELRIVREDLMNYVSDLQTQDYRSEKKEKKEENTKENKEKKKSDYTLITGPFEGLYSLFKPLLPNLSIPKTTKKEKKEAEDSSIEKAHTIVGLSALEDCWKVYTIYKVTHGHMKF